MGIRENVPLKPYTSFKIGGPADYFAQPVCSDQLKQIIEIAGKNGIPCTIMGSGTNILVKDRGIRGLVLSLVKMEGEVRISSLNKNEFLVKAPAGTILASLCKKTMGHGLEDLSFAAGIPGTVGGAVMMNAGTGTGTISDHLCSIDILNYNGTIHTLNRDQLTFLHRKLEFPSQAVKGHDSGQAAGKAERTIKKISSPCSGSSVKPEISKRSFTPVILTASFVLKKGSRDKVTASWKLLMDKRRVSQPHGLASAGCFFKNPANGKSAGELIDKAGLKNRRIGDAMVSEVHANFIVNLGNATAHDILALHDIVKSTVKREFNITLSAEVVIKGE